MKLKTGLIASLLATGLIASSFAVRAETLRFASEVARSDSQIVAAERFNELVKAKTNGALDVKVFADSQLGTSQQAITGVRGGTIDMAISGSNNYVGMVPLLGIFDIPFLFKDTAHAYRVLDGKIGQDILDKFDALGLKGLAYWDNGWRQMTNSRRPIVTPADVKGLKMRTTGSPAHIEAFKLLGANPVPMPIAELYTALEMRTVDAQEHPIGVFWSSKFYEVQKHVSLTYHAYSAIVMVMNKEKFDKLPPPHQKAIVEAARESAQYQRKLNNDNIAKIVVDLRKEGITVTEKVDPAPFLEATKPVRKAFTDKFGGADIIQAIDAVRDVK